MPTIGIDLGTTNSAAAIVEGEEAEMIEIDRNEIMRSVLAFEPRVAGDQEEVIVGESAVDYLKTDPDTTVASVKRYMGDDHPYTFDGEDMEYQPEMVSGLILRKIAQAAEAELTGVDDINEAIVTVPARFSEAARSCTEAAAHYAYIDSVPMLLPEPSAACVAYKVDDDSEDIERVAVYDFGGGTCDLSIVNVVPEDKDQTSYSVEKNEGRQQLGGEDFDEELQDWLIEEFEAETGVSLEDAEDPYEARSRVRAEAKNVKEQLSDAERVTARVPFLAEGETLEIDLTREKFRELTGHLVEKTIDICEEAFDDLGFPPSEVDTVLTVGGTTEMLQVQKAVKDFFGQEPVGGVNPDKAVALGAAKQAKVMDERPTLPPSEDGKDSEEGGALPSPGDEVVPVAPADIGFELADGSLEVLIEEDMSLPAEVTGRDYTTEKDEQTSAEIRVFRGTEETDTEVAENNEHVKTFSLDNIREAPQGVPNIAVKFTMDRSGIVRAEAWDESMGEDSAAESELDMEPKGGESDGGPADAYAPPPVEEIKARRDDLPPVT